MRTYKQFSKENNLKANMRPWSLTFIDPVLESQYVKERLNLDNKEKATKAYIIAGSIIIFVLVGLDTLLAFFADPDYEYSFGTIVSLLMFIPLMLTEYIFYKFQIFSYVRGSVLTCCVYFIIIFNSGEEYSASVNFPILPFSTTLWHSAIFCYHLYYVKSWIVTFIMYIVVYVEVIFLVLLYYGEKLTNTNIWASLINLSYYWIILTAFIILVVFAVRNFEFKERYSFLCEQQAKNELEEWRTLLNDLPEPVILVENGRIVYWNNSTCTTFNVGDDAELELQEKFQSIIVDDQEEMSFSRLINNPSVNLNKGGYTYIDEQNGRQKFYITHVLIKSAMGTSIAEYIFQNVTMVEELERQKAEQTSYRFLISSASHDILTPLNAIQGVLDIFSNKFSDEDEQQELDVAIISAQRLKLYIKGLMILQQIESKKLVLDKNTFSPNNVVCDLLKYFNDVTNVKGVELSMNECTSLFIMSDKEKYELIVYHIIDNAIKTTHEGTIKIDLKYSPDDRCFITSVIDTSIGIDKTQQESLFKLFSEKADFDPLCPHDANLGLYLANKLSNYMGGILKITSSVGNGTTITFELKTDAKQDEEEFNSDSPHFLVSSNYRRRLYKKRSKYLFL